MARKKKTSVSPKPSLALPDEDHMLRFRAEAMVQEEFMKSPTAKKAVTKTLSSLKKARQTAKKLVRGKQ